MSKPYSLIAIPVPYEDEAPGSLLLRASAKNGYSTPMKLLKVLESIVNPVKKLPIKLETILRQKEAYLNACDLLTINISVSHVSIPTGNSQTFARQDFFGIDMQTRLIRKTSHFCPLCVADRPYFKRQWDHEFMLSCSEHNVRLVNKCYACHEPITWQRKSVHVCNCGADLLGSDVVPQKNESSVVLSEFFLSQNREGYETFLDFYQALVIYFGGDHHMVCLDYAAIGYSSEMALAEILFDELRDSEGIRQFHPKLSLIDFMASCNPRVKKVAELVNDKVANLNGFEVFNYDYDDMLDLKEVSATLGIDNKQVLELRNHEILKSFQAKPNAKKRILKSAVNALLMNLSNIALSDVKKFVSLRDLLNDSKYDLRFFQVIKNVLDGNIKLMRFSWQDSLLDMLIERPLPVSPIESYKELVPLKDFISFSLLDSNVIRDRIRENSLIEYYENDGNSKYLTLDNAEILLKYIKERAQLKKTIDRLQPLQSSEIPKKKFRILSYHDKSLSVHRRVIIPV
ncbi:TniQ family protein [Methylophaga sp.]|uniref:TniQ family protein n=1 Tax=Methylophaga sp. TaxID=2024840 RepID=UPI003A933661